MGKETIPDIEKNTPKFTMPKSKIPEPKVEQKKDDKKDKKKERKKDKKKKKATNEKAKLGPLDEAEIVESKAEIFTFRKPATPV